jgi:hypothetical protein
VMLGMCSPAHASRLPPIDSQWVPPKRFDHPYRGRVVVKRVAMDDAPGEITYAYTYGDTGGICVIYVNERWRGPLGFILRHEIGHCNGWVHA